MILPIVTSYNRFYYSPQNTIVSDMQKSIIESVAEVFPGVPHQYCQYHFLKNIGNAILSEKHQQLGTLIRDKEIKKEIEKVQREVEIEKKITR